MSNGYDQEAMDARANELCEICKTRRATEWHHCIFKRRKGDARRNAMYNLQHVCQMCHQTIANSYEKNKSHFWWEQFKKHGDPFLEWYDDLAGYPPREFAEERLGADGLT